MAHMRGRCSQLKMKKIFLLTILLIQFLSVSYSQSRIGTEKLLEDFDFAVHQLEVQHQGFSYYEEKAVTDKKIKKLRDEINSPMTKLEYYQVMRKLLGLMNEGHGSVDLPKWSMIKTGLSKSFLPLSTIYLNKELIVTQNYGKNIDGLSKGVKIVAINGESITKITEKLMSLIPTDGFNITSKYEWIGGVNLCLLYRLVYGKHKTYKVEIIEPNKDKSRLLEIPAIRFTRFKSKNAKFEPKFFNFSDFHFEQINDSIVYLSIPSFGDDNIDYEEFYQEKFKAITTSDTKHLILDIQDNGGGEEGNENLLYHYLSDKKIRKYKRVTMLPVPYAKNKNDEGYKLDKWELRNNIAERGEFTCFSDYFSELGYTMPDKKYVYRGKLYVLISGVTFSGGSEFANMIKMTNRGVFIGDETGGAYEGNVSGYSEIVKLPNTKIKFDIPIVHFQMNVEPEIRGRGVIPDFEVPQTWIDYLNNRNSKLDFTKKMIMN